MNGVESLLSERKPVFPWLKRKKAGRMAAGRYSCMCDKHWGFGHNFSAPPCGGLAVRPGFTRLQAALWAALSLKRITASACGPF